MLCPVSKENTLVLVEMKFIMNDVDDSTNIYYLDLNNDEDYELKIIVYHRHIYGREGLSDYEVGSAGSSPNS